MLTNILRNTFYSVGILTCIIILNFSSYSKPITQSSVTQTQVVTKVQEIIKYKVDPNLIGLTVILFITLVVIIGIIYALNNTPTNPTRKKLT